MIFVNFYFGIYHSCLVHLFSPFLVHFSPLVLVLNRTRTGSPASRTGGLGLLGFA